ncbi:MAG TPA: 4a-hydroxytetrahydrobiopterin dehydratase, partial [Thermoleophilaceae bacterium]
WVTATTSSPRPRANSSSVADGTNEAIRTETRMARLSEEEIEARLPSVRGWERDANALVKRFEHGDFQGSVDFVNRLTPAAQEANHHPDLEISWSTVTVRLSTHSEGGITESDFALAASIDAVA